MKSNWFCKYKLAHRGLHNKSYPENSLGAFQNAVDNGFAIELDVRLTKDNKVVVFHDFSLLRMCGLDQKLSETHFDELSQLKLGKSKYKIPTLEEVLTLINGKVPVMIELKPEKKRKTLDIETYKIIKDYSGDLAVKSFNPLSMLWYKKHAPNMIRGMLSSFFDENKLPFIYKIAIKRLWFYRLVKPNFISYDYTDIPNKFLKNKKVPILAWTITSKEIEKETLTKANNVIFQDYIPDSTTNY